MPYKRPKDRFYTLAREQGYRSRAAFKLIQIQKELDIYSGVKRSIDLCAAPGSWLEVLNKECPTLKLGLGLDLERIKPIPKMQTHVCDINTDEADKFIKDKFGGQKAELILCDGAANVRGEYFSDSVQQNTLVISSVKICVKFLNTRGTFVTKFYRSEFYDKALDTLKKLFIEVKSYKPIASRKESAETYIICKKMKALRKSEKVAIIEEIEQLFKQKETPESIPAQQIKNTDKSDNEIVQYMNEPTKKEIDTMFKRKEENMFEIDTQTVYFEDFLNRTVNPETLLYLDSLSIKETNSLEEILNNLKVKSNKKNLVEEVVYICENIQMLNKTDFNFLLKLRKLNAKRMSDLNNNNTEMNESINNEKLEKKKKEIKDKVEKIEINKAKMKAKEEKKWTDMMNIGEEEGEELDMEIDEINKGKENDTEFPLQQIEELESTQNKKEELENETGENTTHLTSNENNINLGNDTNADAKGMDYDRYLKQTLENGDDFKKAQFLAISRKIMDEEGEQELETKAFNKYCFVQDKKLPSWFIKDELNANDKKNILTTTEIDAELKLLNRVKQKHVDKKEQEAKMRQATRKTKKIKKLNKLLDKDTEYTNKEIKGMISSISKKRERPKQYEVVKGKGVGKVVGKAIEGKSRKVFVDRRMKKDKKREKIKKRRGNKFLGRASRNLKKYKRK